MTDPEKKSITGYCSLEINWEYRVVRIGDDMRMNGMDSPAKLRFDEIPALIRALQTLSSTGQERSGAETDGTSKAGENGA